MSHYLQKKVVAFRKASARHLKSVGSRGFKAETMVTDMRKSGDKIGHNISVNHVPMLGYVMVFSDPSEPGKSYQRVRLGRVYRAICLPSSARDDKRGGPTVDLERASRGVTRRKHSLETERSRKYENPSGHAVPTQRKLLNHLLWKDRQFNEPIVLSQWLELIWSRGLSIKGLIPDDLFILLFQRLLERDDNVAKEWVDRVIDPSEGGAGFERGPFQLSIVSSICSHLAQTRPSRRWFDWICGTSERVAKLVEDGAYSDKQTGQALLASLLATSTLACETGERSVHQLRMQADKMVGAIENDSERTMFLQFYVDLLGDHAKAFQDSRREGVLSNIAVHLDETKLLWSDSPIFSQLGRDVLINQEQVVY